MLLKYKILRHKCLNSSRKKNQIIFLFLNKNNSEKLNHKIYQVIHTKWGSGSLKTQYIVF